jgi:hypothetical protein
MFSDTAKSIKFHEIFYLDKYSLCCKIISAAPITNYAGGGVSFGLKEIFFCCKNIYDTVSMNKSISPFHLKRINRVLNFDSIENAKIIKQTYGLNFIQSIWHGASMGWIKLIDTKTNQVIPAGTIMNYSYPDSVKIPTHDSSGLVNGYTMEAGQAVFPYKLTNSIQFVQDFYYDLNQNIFTTEISNCYLFVKSLDEKTDELTLEKRFRILDH